MVGQKECDVLLARLGENPETVIWIHILKRGNCNVYLFGDSPRYSAAILQPTDLPSEPTGFGSDANALWQLLTLVKGWECVLVDKACASPLGTIVADRLKTSVHYLDDIYHVPSQRLFPFDDKSVRRLTLDDLVLLEAAPREVQPTGFWGSLRASLTEGVAAAAIIDSKVVATAFVAARGERYADIGVYTVESFRRRGLATAVASAVARFVQSNGLVPVWGCGEHNLPSLRIAKKLGFAEVSRRTYVVIKAYLTDVLRQTYPVL
jgi:RimJ/RimL family protein N-acetyltransferase